MLGVLACPMHSVYPVMPRRNACSAENIRQRKGEPKEKRGEEMKMKFKSTVQNPKALLYKRFIGLEKSERQSVCYVIIQTQEAFTFDCETLAFTKIPYADRSSYQSVILIAGADGSIQGGILQYKDTYFYYDCAALNDTKWVSTTTPPDGTADLTRIQSVNVSKYQLNKYYYAGSFDYMIKGSIDGTNTQYVKGNVIPLTSMNIKYFSDDIEINEDDLVVIDGKLYSVETPETVMKYNPRPYKIHYATLNSIL